MWRHTGLLSLNRVHDKWNTCYWFQWKSITHPYTSCRHTIGYGQLLCWTEPMVVSVLIPAVIDNCFSKCRKQSREEFKIVALLLTSIYGLAQERSHFVFVSWVSLLISIILGSFVKKSVACWLNQHRISDQKNENDYLRIFLKAMRFYKVCYYLKFTC